MLMLCLSWGFNQIAVKLALPDVPPMLQALIRSAGALPVLLLIGWLRGVKFFERDGTLWPGLLRGRHLRHRIRADLSRPAADLGVARGGVSLHRAVLRRARLLSVSRRTAARLAMGRAGLEFCRRRAGDRRPAGQCRCQGAAGRPPDRRRRRAVGGHDADRQGDRADQGAAPKKASATRSRCRSRFWASRPGFPAKPSPMFPGRCRCRCWPIRRSGWSA